VSTSKIAVPRGTATDQGDQRQGWAATAQQVLITLAKQSPRIIVAIADILWHR
jgi:hypothetical protein